VSEFDRGHGPLTQQTPMAAKITLLHFI